MTAAERVLLVGNPAAFHVGAHFRRAAESLGVDAELLDPNDAFAAPAWAARLNWWLRGHRPTRLREFGDRVVAACAGLRPRWVLTTGIAPLSRAALRELARLGVRRLNFLTDDPWNPAHRAPWFLEALPGYDTVFTPRRANADDLRRQGCADVCYLPFAYAPEMHFVERPSPDEQQRFDADVLFAGGADPDRVPWVTALIRAGFRVALYGGYWNRDPVTRPFFHGHADLPTLRKATAGAKCVLGLVRRANRDGHAMRSFEVPAMGGCLLAEDTAEHRAFFGAEGEATVYFRDRDEMLRKTEWLSNRPAERARLTQALRERITGGGHTYADRLKAMLAVRS